MEANWVHVQVNLVSEMGSKSFTPSDKHPQSMCILHTRHLLDHIIIIFTQCSQI